MHYQSIGNLSATVRLSSVGAGLKKLSKSDSFSNPLLNGLLNGSMYDSGGGGGGLYPRPQVGHATKLCP